MLFFVVDDSKLICVRFRRTNGFVIGGVNAPLGSCAKAVEDSLLELFDVFPSLHCILLSV